MNKFKHGDKVIEPATGDIGNVEYYDDDDQVLVKWETGSCNGQCLFIDECDIELYVNVVPGDQVTPTEIMYNGKLYVLKEA